jgi:hypothetical protein
MDLKFVENEETQKLKSALVNFGIKENVKINTNIKFFRNLIQLGRQLKVYGLLNTTNGHSFQHKKLELNWKKSEWRF